MRAIKGGLFDSRDIKNMRVHIRGVSVKKFNQGKIFFCVLGLVSCAMSWGMDVASIADACNEQLKNEILSAKEMLLINYIWSNGDVKKMPVLDGVDLNASLACLGSTPLAHAVQEGQEKAVKSLLTLKADPIAKGPDGRTAFSFIGIKNVAPAKCRTIVSLMLDKVDRKQWGMLYTNALEDDNLALLKELCERGYVLFLDAKVAPLTMCVIIDHGSEKVLRFVCENGVNPDSVDDQGVSYIEKIAKILVICVKHAQSTQRAEAMIRYLCTECKVDCTRVAGAVENEPLFPAELKALLEDAVQQALAEKQSSAVAAQKATRNREKNKRRKEAKNRQKQIDDERAAQERVRQEAELRSHRILHAAMLGIDAGAEAITSQIEVVEAGERARVVRAYAIAEAEIERHRRMDEYGQRRAREEACQRFSECAGDYREEAGAGTAEARFRKSRSLRELLEGTRYDSRVLTDYFALDGELRDAVNNGDTQTVFSLVHMGANPYDHKRGELNALELARGSGNEALALSILDVFGARYR